MPTPRRADGAQVVYVDAGTASAELFVVPSDGSAAPRRLNSPLVTGGNVTLNGSEIVITADGTRAVYLADQEEDERFELYSVALDGGSPPVKLHGSLLPDADVRAFRLTGDALQRVVFTADLEQVGTVELFSVPADGSGAPQRLNRSLVGVVGRDVSPFVLDRQGRSAFYLADQDPGRGLHRVRTDGSLPPERISALWPETWLYFAAFQDGYADDRGDSVLFLCERVPGVLELFAHRAPKVGAR